MNCSKILFFVGLLSLTACQSVPNPEKLTRTLAVAGKGNVAIPTTQTKVSLGVNVQGKNAADVQQEVARRSQSVVELLKSRKVEKLQTTGINLSPNYSYNGGKQRITGYSGSNTVSFRIETDKSGNMLDDAVKAGASRIDGVSFVASEGAIAEAQQQAIKEASTDAKKQADAALSALNLSQQEVVSIQINQANPPDILKRYSAALPLDTASTNQVTTPVIASEQQVQATVTLQIRY